MFFLTYEGQLLINWAILAVVALGFRWTYLAGQFSLGHAALMAVGAYFSAKVVANYTDSVPLVILLTIVAAGVAGALMGLLSLRLDGLFLSIATLALAQIVIAVITASDSLGGPNGLAPPLIVEPWTIIYCLIGVTAVSLVLDQTVFTARFRAINSDPLVAESFGMNVRASKLGAWALGGAITGLGGCLYSLSVGSIVPDDFGFNRILLVLLAVLLGGAYSALGSLIGAAIVILLPEVLRNFGVDSSLIYGPVLTLLVLLRPEGLISGFSFVRTIFPQLSVRSREAMRN